METPSPGGVTAIITARGGSKGLPGKNLRALKGKPLIAYTIEAALGSPLISQCFVSTEDPEIRRVSEQWGAEVIDRPAALAQDHSTSEEVVRHALETLHGLGRLTEHFMLLQPTSPLRDSADVTNCVRAFFAAKAGSTTSVCEAEHHPYKNFKLNDGRLEPLFDAKSLSSRRQDLPAVYRQNGAMYCMRSLDFLRESSFFLEPVLPFIMPIEKSVDIDTARDLLLCEQVLTHG